MRLVILMPLRDDWRSAAELIRRVDASLAAQGCSVEVLLVDDASIEHCHRAEFQSGFSVVQAVRILRLRRNLGHQRAIAIGLAHLQKTTECDAVIVMDADGEDTPDGVVQLLRVYVQTHGAKAIFAERSRRSESLVFRSFYHVYRFLHRVFTGITVRVGNFSILPADYLNTLVVVSELWNHYAAGVFRSKLPFSMTPIPRGTRIAGASTMNFVALVSHGLSAISVFGDIVGVRLLIASLAGSLLAAVGILIVAMVRVFTDRAVPGWATYAAGTLVIIMIQFITIATSFTFFMLSSRMNIGFVPIRDYSFFVQGVEDIYP
jgi:glycosyltransferase involved in cell wall biosynthesis